MTATAFLLYAMDSDGAVHHVGFAAIADDTVRAAFIPEVDVGPWPREWARAVNEAVDPDARHPDAASFAAMFDRCNGITWAYQQTPVVGESSNPEDVVHTLLDEAIADPTDAGVRRSGMAPSAAPHTPELT